MTDKTMTLVEAIIDNLCGRFGFDSAFDVDDDVLDEIKREMADAITRHLSQPAERGEAEVCAACRGVKYIQRSSGQEKCWKCDGTGYTAPPPAADVPDVSDYAMAKAAIPSKYWERVRKAVALSATPSPTIDVAAVRAILQWVDANDPHWSQRNKLARAIGNAK